MYIVLWKILELQTSAGSRSKILRITFAVECWNAQET